MSKSDKIVIDEKKFRKEQIQRQRSTDKEYIKKTSKIRIALAVLLMVVSIALFIVVVCFTHDKNYYGFGWWAGIAALYLCNKGRKIIKKSLEEIKKTDSPFNFV